MVADFTLKMGANQSLSISCLTEILSLCIVDTDCPHLHAFREKAEHCVL